MASRRWLTGLPTFRDDGDAYSRRRSGSGNARSFADSCRWVCPPKTCRDSADAASASRRLGNGWRRRSAPLAHVPFHAGGGYPSAAGAFREEPALFAVISGIATFIFNLGNAVVFVGLAGAFATEATSRGAVPRGIALLGVALCLLSTIVAFGMFIGVVAMSSAAPLGLVVFALAAYLGLAIWRQGEPNPRVRQKPPRDSGV